MTRKVKRVFGAMHAFVDNWWKCGKVGSPNALTQKTFYGATTI